MPLPFILAGVAIAAAGYGVKKGIDVLDADCEADEFIKKAESLKEKAKRKVDNVQSSRNQALVRLGKKKLHVLSYTVSNFLDHFHQLKCSRIIIESINMQDIQGQVSDARNLLNQLNTKGIDGDSALGVIAGCGGLGVSSFTAGAIMGGGLAASGLAGMAVFGGLLAAPALAILGAISADEMEKKLENAKAYYSQVEVAVKKADVMVDQFQAVRKMADLFIEQITRFEKIFFSLSIDAITTMKKCNYDTSRFMDEHQKLNEKAKETLILMRDQMNAIESAQESGHYNVAMIQSKRKGLENL